MRDPTPVTPLLTDVEHAWMEADRRPVLAPEVLPPAPGRLTRVAERVGQAAVMGAVAWSLVTLAVWAFQ